MKISNETKIGLLGVIVITLLVIGFNFLKGKKLFSHNLTIYAKYSNIQGLSTSNPVFINGMTVGNVSDISNDKSMNNLLVTITIYKDINIPVNSVAVITPNPLSMTKIDITLGDAGQFIKNGDTILTTPAVDFIEGIINRKVDPLLLSVNNSIHSIDSLLSNVNGIFNENNKRNLAASLENINNMTASIQMMADANGPLSQTLKNANNFTSNLASNNNKIDSIINNLTKTTGNLSQLDLQKTLATLDATINNLKSTLEKVNSKEGSVGMLLNDAALYKNLTSTSNKINLLMDDIRIHPKRYVSISVFGKKQKEEPLQVATPDTINSPYIKNNAN